MKKILTVLTLGIAAGLLQASAQESGDQPPGPPPGGAKHQRPPIIAALDANNDGVIDADEIANASAALKKLDKNGDGKLTSDEIRPPRPAQ